jgi:hypothetical protein
MSKSTLNYLNQGTRISAFTLYSNLKDRAYRCRAKFFFLPKAN